MRRLSPRYYFSISGAQQALWLDEDSLLHVHSGTFQEYHKRFELREIQALSISRYFWHRIYFTGLLACLLPALYLLYYALREDAGPVLLGFSVLSSGILLLGMIWNLALGPTCVCRLHTAVQVETLGGFRRERAARALLDTLAPRIAQVQGTFSAPGPPEEGQAGSDSPVAGG